MEQNSAIAIYPSTVTPVKESKEQVDPTLRKEIQSVGFFQLFRFADRIDILLMVFGTIAAFADGATMPLFTLLWGNMTDAFGASTTDPNASVNQARATMWNFLEIGLGVFFASWIMFGCWMVAGQRQAIRCRKQYLAALLKQEIGWFDRANQTELSSKFSSETFAFGGAIGEKVATFIMTFSMVISGFVIALIKGWQLALVITATLPLLALSAILYTTIIKGKDKKVSAAYATAGGQAEEAIGAIKTVKFLTGEIYEGDKFENQLTQVQKKTSMFALWAGLGMGLLMFVMMASYSLGFWYGAKLIVDHVINVTASYTPGEILVVFFSILSGGINVSQISPCMKAFAEGQQAAARIYAMIDRKPLIVESDDGKVITDLRGDIQLENVTFAYPKDPDRIILKNVSLKFNANQKNALVGGSGCGKSTIMQLVMRFYDPQEGKVYLDGVDVRQLSLKWLRENIGYVGQEPVLFATTIRENLKLGKLNASEEELIQALKQAQAYQFVMDLQQKIDTYVGYGGGQLSGGQKQRLAIARAILKNPKILLLDEATSALDRKNEMLIQKTLDSIVSGRTTISIAHRIGTIINSDQIFVMHEGKLVEKGKFKELAKFKDYVATGQGENAEIDIKLKSKKDLQKAQKLNMQFEDVIVLTREEKEKLEQEHTLKKYDDKIFSRLFKYNRSDVWLFIMGSIGALLNGAIYPVFSLFLARMIEILTYLQIGFGKYNINDANLQALIFLIIGIASFIFSVMQTYAFTIIGDRLTKKIRVECYRKMLKMPVAWFDVPKNNAGNLTARLANDCQVVNGLTSNLVGTGIQTVSCLVTGIVIAFAYDWRTSLVTLGLMPLMILSGYINMKFMVGFSEKSDEAYKDSSSIIMETLTNIRTVTSFGVENSIASNYNEKLIAPFNLAKTRGNLAGILYGISKFTMFLVFALVFYTGALFVRDDGVNFGDVFTAIFAIMFAAMRVGNNSQFMPDVASSKNSAASLFEIIDGEDEQQLQTKHNSKMLKEGGASGRIDINNVSFKYPTRNAYTLTDLSLKVQPGSKVALVGSSGCGKSTIIQMLLRFYQPETGEILLDGVNLKDYDIHYLRRLFGVVSQEPVLFNASFKDNIRYNIAGATDEQIHQAALIANALEFIEGGEAIQDKVDGQQVEQQEKRGFDRGVGVKGSHISGGQKQRVAIARSVLREPSILLLDEATSALDSTNEKIVQDSLDTIMQNKTTVSIAHRFDTIKNSDRIYVFQLGNIIEDGSYNELINKRGVFYNMERGAP